MPENEPSANPPAKRGGRPKGSKPRPHSLLAAEEVARQLYRVVKNDRSFIERLPDRDKIRVITQLGPLFRKIGEDWEPATNDKVYTLEFAGPVSKGEPIPDDVPLPPLEGPVEADADETREESSGVTVDALRAAVAEQDAIAAEDARAARELAQRTTDRYRDGLRGDV